MFKQLFEYYRLTYDSNNSGGISLNPDKALGTTVGKSRSLGDVYDKMIDDDDDYDDIVIDKESEEAIAKKLYQPVYAVDRKRSDLSHTSGGRRQGIGLNEVDQVHTNTARKNSIAPFKQPKFNGPPIGSGNANNIFKTGPARKTGTVHGYSRAPIVLDDDALFFGELPKDKMEISFLRQQKHVKRLKDLIKSIEEH